MKKIKKFFSLKKEEPNEEPNKVPKEGAIHTLISNIAVSSVANSQRNSVLSPLTRISSFYPNKPEPPPRNKPKRQAPPKPDHNQLNHDLKTPTAKNSNRNRHLKLIEDIKLLPECFEASLIRVLYYIACKNSTKEPRALPSAQSNEFLQNEFNQITQHLKKEYDDPEIVISSLSHIKSLTENNEWKIALEKTNELLSNTRSLNINKIRRILPEVNKAANVIANQSVLLFLGNESCGRSLAIHYLAGSEIKNINSKLVPTSVTRTVLNEIKVKSLDEKSEEDDDEYLVPVPVSDQIVLCDTPCLTNNTDIETDIIEGLSIVNAIATSRRVKPVIVISKDDFENNFKEVKLLVQKLLMIMTSLELYLDSFTYLFTKFTGEKSRELSKALNDFEQLNSQNLSDDNEIFNKFYKDMKTKVNEGAIFINFDTSREILLNELLRGSFIDNPGDAFNFTISGISYYAIDQQLMHHKCSIFTSTAKCNYNLVESKLGELRFLCEIIGDQNINVAFDECIKHIRQHFVEEFENFKSILSQGFNKNNKETLLEMIERARKCDSIHQKFLSRDDVSSANYTQFVRQIINAYIGKIGELELDDCSLQMLLVVDLVNTFLNENEQKEFNELLIEIINRKLDAIEKSFSMELNENNFQNCICILTKLIKCLYICENDIRERYENAKRKMIEKVESQVKSISEILENSCLNEEKSKNISNFLSALNSLLNNLNIDMHFSKESISFYYKDAVDVVIAFYSDKAAVARNFLEESKCNDSNLQKTLHEIIQLMTIVQVKAEKSKDFDDIMLLTRKKIMREIEENFKEYKYEDAFKLVAAIKECNWILDTENLFNRAENAISTHLKKIFDELKDTKLDWMCSSLIQYYSNLKNLANAQVPMNLSESLSNLIENIKNKHESEMQGAFESIDKIFSNDTWKNNGKDDIELSIITKGFTFLNSQNDINEAENYKKKGKMMLDSYFEHIDAEIKAKFAEITSLTNVKNTGENVAELAKHLNKLVEIQDRHKQLYEMLNENNKKIIYDWKIKFSTYDEQLSTEIKTLMDEGKHEEMSKKLILANSLSLLDKSGVSGIDYGKYYKENLERFYAQAPEEISQALTAINNHEYDIVAKVFRNYDFLMNTPGNDFQSIATKFALVKKSLNTKIDKLVEVAKYNVNFLFHKREIDLRLINDFVNIFNKIESAHFSLSQHINIRLDEVLGMLKKNVSSGLNGAIVKFKRSLDKNEFIRAEEELEILNKAYKTLMNACENDVGQGIKNLNDLKKQKLIKLNDDFKNFELKELINSSLNNLFETLLETSATIYDDLETTIKQKDLQEIGIQDFHAIRKFLFNAERANELDKIATLIKNTTDEVKEKYKECLMVLQSCLDYDYTIIAINENLLNRLKNKIDIIKKMPFDGKRNSEIKALKYSLKYLPSDIRKNIEYLITELEDCTSLVKIIDDVISSRCLNEIKKLLDNSRALPHFEIYQEKVKDFALKELRECKNDIEKESDVDAFLNKLSLAYDIKQNLSEYFSGDLNKVWNEIKNFATKTYAEKEALAKDWSISGLDFLLSAEKYQESQFIKEILPKFDDKLKDLIADLVKRANDNQKAFDEALVSRNFTYIYSSLDSMKKFENVLQKLKLYHSLKSYDENKELITKDLHGILKQFLKEKFLNENTERLQQQSDEYYANLNKKLEVIETSKILKAHFDTSEINWKQIEQDITDKIREQIDDIALQAGEFLYVDNESLVEKSRSYNMILNNLNCISKNITSYNVNTKSLSEKLTHKVNTQVISIKQAAKKSENMQEFTEKLIQLKIISDNIYSSKDSVVKTIEELLLEYKRTHGAQVIAQLGVLLDKSPIGESIVSEHTIFAGYNLAIFNTLVSKHGIDYVLEKIKGDGLDNKKEIEKLRNIYKEYDKEYKKVVLEYLKPTMDLDKLILDIKQYIGKDLISSKNGECTEEMRQKLPKILAKVFALWTLMNASHYFEADGVENQSAYLFTPHPAQVVAIFRVLGIGDSNALRNNLVQIGTGEGKSVVLSVTATVLALLGYDISCVCYSDYLSQRDYKAFKPLFEAFNLTKFIHYGTFQKLCENFINRNGSVRTLVESLIKAENYSKSIQHDSNRPKLLLIDEVDVFFSKDFYGNTYSPCASIKHPAIIALTDYLWSKKDSLPSFDVIKSSNEYHKCVSEFEDYEFLVEEALKDMLVDIQSYEHEYELCDNKIGYKEMDTVVFNAVYGYKTMFAYYSEFTNGNISRESLEQNVSIQVNCGVFSYAEIAHEFKHIIGVTGTLESLAEPQKDIIKNEYKVEKSTYMPSVFGENNLKFTDILIENSSDYYNVLSREISNRLMGQTVGTKRAVLIFFESKNELKKFFDSSAFSVHKDTAALLTEDAYLHEKESIIKNATLSGQVTLLTRSFGRGTDFIVRDAIVKSNGGVHVIQTFFSDDISEEIQIKGRTARQGELGSYSLVLLDQNLQKFSFSEDCFNLKRNDVYDLLNGKRNEIFKDEYKTNKEFVESVRKTHRNSLNFIEALHKDEVKAIKSFLSDQNKGSVIGVSNAFKSRTLCLMDATSSMGSLLQKAKNNVGIMFERACQVLIENESSSTFEMQFACYRDYDSLIEGLLEVSPWETKPDNLKTFMDKIVPKGGEDIPEAVEIGLWHANKEHEKEPISQVILIGDAPAKERNKILEYRKKYRGEDFWKKSKFGELTHFSDELSKLIERKVPVYAFYLNDVAKKNFEEIAQQSGGECKPLNIKSDIGTKILTDLITEQILRSIGQHDGNSQALLNSYRERYGRSYN